MKKLLPFLFLLLPALAAADLSPTKPIPVSKGGTGASSLTSNNVILGNGTGAVQFVAPSTSGNVLTSNGTTWQSTAPAAGGAKVAGEVFMFGGSSCPTGSIAADGGSRLRSGTYANLFTAISTYHGNGSTAASGATSDGGCPHASNCFNVPDLRGKFARGVAGGSSSDPDRASRSTCATGGNSGDNVGACQSYSNYAHTHTTQHHKGTLGVIGGSNTYIMEVNGGLGQTYNYDTTSSSSGGNEARPINVGILYCIQY